MIVGKVAETVDEGARILFEHARGTSLSLLTGREYNPAGGYFLLNRAWPSKRRLRISYAALATESALERIERWLSDIDEQHQYVVSWWEDEAFYLDIAKYYGTLMDAQLAAIQAKERELFNLTLWRRVDV